MKSKMNKHIAGMLSLTLLMQLSPSAFAKTTMVQAGANLAYPMLSQSPGNYSYSQVDQVQMQKLFLDPMMSFSQRDTEYIAATVKSLDAHIEAFITDNVKFGLSQLSDESRIPGKSATIDSFIEARRNFLADFENLKVKIMSLTALPEVGSVNNHTIVVQGTQIMVDGAVKADFKNLVANYTLVIGKIQSDMEAKTFNILDPNGNGAIIQQQGLQNLAKELTNPYTLDKINQMAAEAANLRLTPFNIRNQINKSVNAYTATSMKSAIENFGKAETLRLSDPANSEKGKADSLKELEGIMFARSLIRIMYGVKTGTPAISYTRQAFNWDFFSSGNDLVFHADSIIDQNEQRSVLAQVNEAIRTQDSRSQEVFGGTADFISRAASAMNWLKGERSLSRMNGLILNLIKHDIEEDMAVGEVGGLRKLKDMYKARYYSSPENEQYYRQKKTEVVALLEPSQAASATEDDGFGDVRSADNGAVGVLTMVGSSFQQVRRRIERADQLEAIVATYDQGSHQRENTNKRLGGI